jgi:hypothetical protein
MREDYWRKHLSDGTLEFGYDSCIQNKLASWTKGRQDIQSTLLSFNGNFIQVTNHSLSSLTKWEQKDGYLFNPSNGSTIRIDRNLECSVNGKTRFCITEGSLDGGHLTLFDLNDQVGQLIPTDIDFLVCCIRIDGKVNYRWK